MPKSKLLVVITGGTIDSHFDPATDSMRPLNETSIGDYFKIMKLPFPYDIKTVCMKDSREITDDDRRKMAQYIRESSAKHIMLTHGTFTMPITAEYLAKEKDLKDKTIVLVGSFIPLQQFSSLFSDAPFNIGFALGQAMSAKPGVYVAMHGTLFPAGKVQKNIAAARFEKS